MKDIKAMLLDLDGTLLDSAPDMVGSLICVSNTDKLPPLTVDDLRRFASK